VFLPKGESAKITATNADDANVKIDIQRDGDSVRLKFPNNPKGVTVEIK